MNKKPICIGTGLVALDVILNGSPTASPKLSAGGSCGNVLSILGYLGWNSFPIARLADDQAGVELISDLLRWNVQTNHITNDADGSTPIIIHRILKDKQGMPAHRFEFRDPDTKTWLPQFKGITKNIASEIIQEKPLPQLFYFDRMNPGTFELATYFKSKGSIIYFEPSSSKDIKQFEKFLALADIIKFSHDRIPDYRNQYTSSQCLLEIITYGQNGLVYRSKKYSKPNHWNTMKSFTINNIQDAAGAGDWCTSGIIDKLCSAGISGLMKKTANDIELALEFGQELGALNCLFDGARGLMYYYSFDDLITLINSFNKKRSVTEKNIFTVPRIDISSKIKFSELYYLAK